MKLMLRAIRHTWVLPQSPGLQLEDQTEFLAHRVGSMLHPFAIKSSVSIGMLVSKQEMEINCCTDDTEVEVNPKPQMFELPDLAFVYINLEANPNESRDDLETSILNIFDVPNLEIDFLNFTTLFQVQFLFLPVMELTVISFYYETTGRKFFVSDLHFNGNVAEKVVNSYSFIAPFVRQLDHLIQIRPALVCPYVEMSSNNLTILIDPNSYIPIITKISLRFDSQSFELTEPHQLNQVGLAKEQKSFYVCKDLLDGISVQLSTRPDGTRNSLSDVIQYVLTTTCLAFSFICLLATVVTYSLFPSLRCVAGSNTMGLSISLMAAQLLLLVANAMKGPGFACTAVGMATHFSWLVMFTWSLLCCFHMLRVFTAVQAVLPGSSSKDQTRRTVARNVAVSLVLPLLVVGSVVIINYVTSDGQVIGYGLRSCAMDDVLTLHVPLMLVTISNVFFFTTVVIKIWRVRRLQTGHSDFRKEDWKNFIIYIKLSTLTGMFWLLIILGEAFENDIIRYVAIVTNGFQGLFIFTSFIFNRRVYKKYVKMCPIFRPNNGKSSTTGRTESSITGDT